METSEELFSTKMKQHLPFGQFSPDAFKDVGDCEYFLEDDQDVFVFKFPNGHGARVSKPAGLYQNKINIWTLRPIVKTGAAFWSVDPIRHIKKDLIEFDIPVLLNNLKSL